jgi:hypothetical protein
MHRKLGPYAQRLWRSFIHQELGLFLKQIIAHANASVPQREKLGQGFVRLIAPEMDILSSQQPEHERLITRNAVSQMLYYMGHIQSDITLDFLETAVRAFPDEEFLRRGAIIGLAFGGRLAVLNEFVDELAREKTAGGSVKNLTNLGHQLSYFGDQPYDYLRPDKIQQFGPCRNTVCKLLMQLLSPEYSPSWRLDAYTIIYLASKSPWSTPARLELLVRRQELQKAAIALKVNPVSAQWPETTYLIELAKEMNHV